MDGKTRVAVIIPVYNEESSIGKLYEELAEARNSVSGGFNIVFVDDGSADGSNSALKKIAENDGAVSLITLKKNCGQTVALDAGIKSSAAEIVVAMDADLQNDPKDIPELLKALDEGADVVSGWRRKRKDSFLVRVLPSRIANSLISFITGLKLHDYGCTLKAYRSEYLRNISIYGEMHRFLPAYCAWQGARVREIEVNHRPRLHGHSNYGLGRTYKVLLDLLVLKFVLSYLTRPMHLFGGVALISFILGLGVNGFIVVRKLFANGEWLSPLFFFGVLLWSLAVICLLLGFVAEIAVRLYLETRQKDIYGIKEKINI